MSSSMFFDSFFYPISVLMSLTAVSCPDLFYQLFPVVGSFISYFLSWASLSSVFCPEVLCQLFRSFDSLSAASVLRFFISCFCWEVLCQLFLSWAPFSVVFVLRSFVCCFCLHVLFSRFFYFVRCSVLLLSFLSQAFRSPLAFVV
jgi:hypothetical protein